MHYERFHLISSAEAETVAWLRYGLFGFIGFLDRSGFQKLKNLLVAISHFLKKMPHLCNAYAALFYFSVNNSSDVLTYLCFVVGILNLAGCWKLNLISDY